MYLYDFCVNILLCNIPKVQNHKKSGINLLDSSYCGMNITDSNILKYDLTMVSVQLFSKSSVKKKQVSLSFYITKSHLLVKITGGQLDLWGWGVD